MSDCVFCEVIKTGGATGYVDYGDVVVFRPLNPVTAMHRLVVPKRHVRDALEDPEVTAETFGFAASYASVFADVNLITSAGAAATQTVMHLHVHVVPRAVNDGLALPWTAQVRQEEKHDGRCSFVFPPEAIRCVQSAERGATRCGAHPVLDR